jgi:hypothetical protein
MFVHAWFTSAVAMSVAVGLSQRSPPGQSLWVAAVMADGNVEVSRDGGASAVVVARCPARVLPVEQDTAPSIVDPDPELAADDPDAAAGPLLDLPSPSATSLDLDPGDIDASVLGDPGAAPELAGAARASCGSAPPPARIAWREDALYVACSAGPVYRWREETGSWPLQLAARAAQDDGLPAPMQVDRIVAMLGGAKLRVVDASQRLWMAAHDGDDGELQQIGTVPEPVSALAEWQGSLVAAGTTAVWRRSLARDAPGHAWEPLVTITACALSADRASLWLAGPAGLVELSGERVRVHALAPLTGIAVHDDEVWLASGRGPLVRAALAAAASDMLDGELRLAPASDVAGVAAGHALRALSTRARRARWLPGVATRARWSRASEGPGTAAGASWREGLPGSHAGELVLFVWFTWTLDPEDPAAIAGARSWP